MGGVGGYKGGIELLNGFSGSLTSVVSKHSQSSDLEQNSRKISFLGPNSIISSNNDGSLDIFNQNNLEWDQDSKFSCSLKTIHYLSVWHYDSEIAVGGQGKDLIIIDSTNGTTIFESSNPKMQWPLQTDKQWPLCAVHISKSCIAVGTNSCKLKIYDIRAKTTPSQEVFCGNSQITSITTDDALSCWTGSSIGEVRRYDMVANQMVESLLHNTGTITSVQCSPDKTLIAAVSLDHKLTLYKAKDLIAELYFDQQLKSVRFLPRNNAV